MSEASKTLGNKLNDAWDNLTQPHRPGPEVGADLQAQAAAYDYANAAPTAEEAARNAADLAAAKTDVAHEEAVSGLRGTGEYLADAAAGAQSSLATAKEYATSASASLADTHAATQESAHNAQASAVSSLRDAGTHIAGGLEVAGEKAGDTVSAIRSKLGL
ncbi:hypothetical protein ACKKBG_A06345 [Auxenochlorella protothecoides x Auxenochlorella symbiontica]